MGVAHETDEVDRIVEAWIAQRPDLDFSPLEHVSRHLPFINCLIPFATKRRKFLFQPAITGEIEVDSTLLSINTPNINRITLLMRAFSE